MRLARGDWRNGQSGARDLSAQEQGNASRCGQRSPAPRKAHQDKKKAPDNAGAFS
jgi:hypothetical protein